MTKYNIIKYILIIELLYGIDFGYKTALNINKEVCSISEHDRRNV